MVDTNLKFNEVYNLSDLVAPAEEKVQFANIFATANGGTAALAFKAGQKLDPHTAPAELMVTVLKGEIEFTMLDKPHTLKAGDFILVGEGAEHSVAAKDDSLVLLAKIKS